MITTKSALDSRLKKLERASGLNGPIIVVEYGKEDGEKKAKEMGMTLEEYENYLNRRGAIRVKIHYTDD